jgi:S1-C subfamily serine protease
MSGVQASRRSSLLAALAGGVVGALAVIAILLAAGAFDDEPGAARAGGATTSAAGVLSVGDVYRRSRLSVLLVDHRPPGVPPRRGAPTRSDRIATGTAFLVDGAGHLVTNQHIVAGRGTTTVQLRAGRGSVGASVLARDSRNDLAVMRVDPVRLRGLRPLPLGDSGAVRTGDTAIAIGNPFGLQRSLSVGVVSAVGRTIGAPAGGRIRGVVQTDAAINPGNSGGPLLDDHGRVIGVMSQGRGSGIAFAVPVDAVKRLLAKARRMR